MNQDEKRKLENQLMTQGLPGLDDPLLYQQMAELVNRWPGDKNQFLVDLLNECDADKRYQAYQSLVPHLKFKALSFIDCEMSIAERASETVSRGQARVEGKAPKPIQIGESKYVEVRRGESTHAVVKLICHKCTRRANFIGPTPVTAMLEARKAGWVRDLSLNKEICPKCPAVREGTKVGVA